MLHREIIAVCSEIHTKHTNTLRGQSVEFVNVKPDGTYSNLWALKGYAARGIRLEKLKKPGKKVKVCEPVRCGRHRTEYLARRRKLT